jgi:transcriptional regulator with XRE-family HTH domain
MTQTIELTRQREARRWTKRELGARADLHPSRVGVIENGRVVPYDVELARLAHALGYTGDPHDLLALTTEVVGVES